MQEGGGDHLRLPRVVASGRNACDERPFQASLASLDPGDGFVVGSMPLEHGPGDLALPLERWPTACLRVRSGSLAKTGGKQIDNAPLVYRVVTLSWGDRSNFSASFLSRRNGRNGGFAAIWLARISVKGAS